MARADLLVSIVRAGSEGDRERFRKAVQALAAEEREKRHGVLADRLEKSLRAPDGSTVSTHPAHDERIRQLLTESVPRKTLDDLILPETVSAACAELVEEQHRVELLRSYGIEPRHRVLLAGTPGNGKTSLAEAVAERLMVPMLTVRYEGVIGSFLGETAQRLRQIFDYVATRRCVLFFDEFDAIGKERGDVHETGEIKRVVSSLLLQMDNLPSHVVVVVASNHPELLDRAVWRRFQLRLELPPPTQSAAEEWFQRLAEKLDAPLGRSPRSLAMHLKGLSFAEIEDFAADLARRYVLGLPDSDLKRIVNTRLRQWKARFQPPKSD
jgi:SpoVK/Ycf46/Vps4 family AAA+-type ATPase